MPDMADGMEDEMGTGTMKRYRLVTSHDSSGGYCEFSAVDDAAALVVARGQLWNDGRIVALSEITWPASSRQVAVPS
jgi:hypothetical protein